MLVVPGGALTWYAMYSGAAPVLMSLRLVSGFFTMERATRRPMRPKPLMPVSTAMDSWVEDAADLLVTAAPLKALGATKAEADPARAMAAAALRTGAMFIISSGWGDREVGDSEVQRCACRTNARELPGDDLYFSPLFGMPPISNVWNYSHQNILTSDVFLESVVRFVGDSLMRVRLSLYTPYLHTPYSSTSDGSIPFSTPPSRGEVFRERGAQTRTYDEWLNLDSTDSLHDDE